MYEEGWKFLFHSSVPGWPDPPGTAKKGFQTSMVTSNIPQGLSLFNIFVSSRDSEFEGTFSRFADDSELCGAVDSLEERDGIQRDLDGLESWACAKQTS